MELIQGTADLLPVGVGVDSDGGRVGRGDRHQTSAGQRGQDRKTTAQSFKRTWHCDQDDEDVGRKLTEPDAAENERKGETAETENWRVPCQNIKDQKRSVISSAIFFPIPSALTYF